MQTEADMAAVDSAREVVVTEEVMKEALEAVVAMATAFVASLAPEVGSRALVTAVEEMVEDAVVKQGIR